MLTLFGVAALSLMVVAYALEEHAPKFVLLFAGACAVSSVYGVYGRRMALWRCRSRLDSRRHSPMAVAGARD